MQTKYRLGALHKYSYGQHKKNKKASIKTLINRKYAELISLFVKKYSLLCLFVTTPRKNIFQQN